MIGNTKSNAAETRLLSILSEIFEIPPEEIHEDLTPETVPNWDSLNALRIISDLEEAFQFSFTTEEASSIGSVGDIRKVLSRHGLL